MATPDFSQSWHNYTSDDPSQQTNFNLVGYWTDIGQNVLNQHGQPGTVIQEPSKILDPTATQTLSWSQSLLNMPVGDVNSYVAWQNPRTGYRFGIFIRKPVQILYIGTNPYWKIFYDDGTRTFDPFNDDFWTKPEESPTKQYTFPDADKIGALIKLTPTAGETTLLIEISVYAVPKAG
jgi:hypothetical protein